MLNVPVIPRLPAEAIEWYRDSRAYVIVDVLNIEAVRRRSATPDNRRAKTLIRYYDVSAQNRRNYLAAILNGYTTEQPLAPSADDLKRAAYERIRTKYENAAKLAQVFPYDAGYQHGILFALTELGVTIAGVNTDESEVIL